MAGTISAEASEGVVSTRAPIEDPEQVNEALGEFHGQMFLFTEAAREAGDEHAAAVAAYLHDQFCILRVKLRAGSLDGIGRLAPYPTFQSTTGTTPRTEDALRSAQRE